MKGRPDTLKVISHPEVEPVTLADARAQIGLFDDQVDHDRFLMSAISTARRLVESRLGIALVATRFRATWREAPELLRLPVQPLLLASGFDLEVEAGDEELDEEDYELDSDAVPASIDLKRGIGKKVVVTYWAGVAPGEPIDPMLRSALLAYVDHQFNNRGVLASESSTELPQAFETLLAASSWNGAW
jgi:uncharacterized phiE125 gp8 family phage protein